MSTEFVADETLTIEGTEALKSLGEEGGKVRVGAYAIRFAGPEEKDLTGEYFTAKTDFGPRNGDGVCTMFNHGVVPAGLSTAQKAVWNDVASKTFGPVTMRRDAVGIFAEAVLNTANEYEKAIAELCAAGKLKWSSGSSPHLCRKNADGEITRWHPIEVSYTPKAAEPRLPAVRPLKSLAGDDSATAEVAKAFEPKSETAAAAAGVDSRKAVNAGAESAATKAKITFPSMTPEEKAAAEKAQNEAISTATKARLAEVNEITALGNHFKCVEEATTFIAEGKSLNDFRQHVLENVKKAKPVITDPKIGMSKKDLSQWSIVKAVREIVLGGGAHALTGIEKEASEASQKTLGIKAKGFLIPHDVALAGLDESKDLGALAMKALIENAAAMKSLSAGTFGSGGALVGTNLLTGSMIELLRNKPLVAQMGARSLTGLVGNVAIPRLNGGATAYWVGESGTITESAQAFGQLGLTPKKLAGRTKYTKELLNQTDLSVEALVRDDITTVLGLAKDLAALNGTGGAQPLGIINQPAGLNSVTFGATATRQKATDFQKEVAVDNASRGSLAYLTTPTVAGKWMNIQEATNYPEFLWKGNIDQGMVVGRPAFSTNQVPSDKVIYGNWNDLLMADWAGWDVVVNPYTNDATGEITITIFLLTDNGVRHVVSFCVSTDSGAQ